MKLTSQMTAAGNGEGKPSAFDSLSWFHHYLSNYLTLGPLLQSSLNLNNYSQSSWHIFAGSLCSEKFCASQLAKEKRNVFKNAQEAAGFRDVFWFLCKRGPVGWNSHGDPHLLQLTSLLYRPYVDCAQGRLRPQRKGLGGPRHSLKILPGFVAVS